ncbi:MAG: hypothetical protein ACRD1X_14590 [Vicinamibacteria bacterium]
MRAILLAAVLLAPPTACSPESTVVNGDRRVLWQTYSAARILNAAASRVGAAIIGLAGVPPTALQDLALIKMAGGDIEANAAQLVENFGGPDRIPDKKEYTAQVSKEARDDSKKDHEKLTWWHLAGGTALTILGWALKTTVAAKIPILGTLLGKLNGGVASEKLNFGLQAVLDKARSEFDERAAALLPKVPESLRGIAEQLIPKGDDLKKMIEEELARRGLLEFNTKLYDKNPEIPEEAPTIVVRAAPEVAPSPPA